MNTAIIITVTKSAYEATATVVEQLKPIFIAIGIDSNKIKKLSWEDAEKELTLECATINGENFKFTSTETEWQFKVSTEFWQIACDYIGSMCDPICSVIYAVKAAYKSMTANVIEYVQKVTSLLKRKEG